MKDISEVASDQILMWAQRVEAQRVQKEVLDDIRDAEEFQLGEISRNMTVLGRIRKNDCGLQILLYRTPPEVVLSIWQDVWWLWQ